MYRASIIRPFMTGLNSAVDAVRRATILRHLTRSISHVLLDVLGLNRDTDASIIFTMDVLCMCVPFCWPNLQGYLGSGRAEDAAGRQGGYDSQAEERTQRRAK